MWGDVTAEGCEGKENTEILSSKYEPTLEKLNPLWE
jgi:hypothetical protein